MPATLHRTTLEANELVFREGETGDCAFVIESGVIQISSLRDGQDVALAQLGNGELIGEMALLDGQLRSATARVIERATLIVIRRDQVLNKIKATDPLLKLFLKVILARLRSTNALVGGRLAPERRSPDDSFPAVRDRALTMLRQEQAMEEALSDDQLRLYYQPLVDVVSRRAVGFEALVRWQHPRKGLLPPGQFIELAERTGLIIPMGRWVLQEACAALARFQAKGQQTENGKALGIAVNLSARQLNDEGLVEYVRDCLSVAGIDPRRLTLEVTESALMIDPELAIGLLNRFRDFGIRVAVDDFGTGYSSLSYLHRFPIDILKIDRSFIGTMMEDESSIKIVRTVAMLARELGLSMVAEGIESPDQLGVVAGLECQEAQGYLFAKPLPEEQAIAVIGKTLGG